MSWSMQCSSVRMLQSVPFTSVRILGPNLPLDLHARPANCNEITVIFHSQISGISKVTNVYMYLMIEKQMKVMHVV